MLNILKKYFGDIYLRRIKQQSKNKLVKIYKNINKPNSCKNLINNYRDNWKILDKNIDFRYMEIYTAANGIKSINYVPEDIYYSKIEPTLNNRMFASAYSDKNFYEIFISKYKNLFPATYIRAINGFYYDRCYNNIEINIPVLKKLIDKQKDYIIKPSIETSGGKEFEIIYSINSKLKDDDYYENIIRKIRSYRNGFVLQERINSLDWFSNFNSTSLNTIRFYTYTSVISNKTYCLSSVLRFGKPGSIVDNQAAGGLTCGITKEGILNKYAVDKMGKVYKNIQAVVENSEKYVPYFNEMIEIVCDIAKKFHYHRLLGFDVTVDEYNKVRVLEVNCKNIEINFLQMNNGPLFSNFTKEIIDYTVNNRGTFILNMKI